MGLKERDVVLTAKDSDNNNVIQFPITRVDNVEGAVKTVNGIQPTEDGNVVVTIPPNDWNTMQNKPGTFPPSSHRHNWGDIDGAPANPRAYVTETWVSGRNWYRKWSDGWKEQGGKMKSGSAAITVNLHRAFANTNYVVVSSATSGSNRDIYGLVVRSLTTTNFVTYVGANAGSVVERFWYACGY